MYVLLSSSDAGTESGSISVLEYEHVWPVQGCSLIRINTSLSKETESSARKEMGKKSKRQAVSASVQKPQDGAVMNNRAVCRVVNELWESK